MSFVLVAHGTRVPRGVSLIGDLADRVAQTLDRPVHVAFVDVLGPTPAELLSATTDRATVLVPAFLARGYHVRHDIPAHVADSGHPDVTVTAALGPDPALVRILVDRLLETGWRPDDSVILAAAGTSDPDAMRDLHTTATGLSAVLGSRVELAFAATGEPRVADAAPAPPPSAPAAPAVSWWRPTCCRRGCSRTGCAPAAPTWSPIRWAHTPGSPD